MDTLGQTLQDRYTSSFPLSIGTALALESIFDPKLPVYDAQRIIPPRIQLSNYDSIYINLFTLYRNMVTSFDKNVFLKTSVDDLVLALLGELSIIESLFSVEGMGTTVPYFYHFTYKALEKIDDRIKIREDHTDWQIAFKQTYLKVIQELKKHILFIAADVSLEKQGHKALMISHVPYDLLNYKQFKQLDLLESNTGKLKPRTLWNTKYYPLVNQDMSHLPFNRLLLLLFGDRVSIQPSPIKLRRLLMDISIQGQWTVATTVDKIKFDIDLYMKDHYIKNFIKSL